MIETARHTTHESLFPPQEEILQRGLLSSGYSCVLQLPTGTGKTWLAMKSVRSVLKEGRRAVYLAPLRAVAEELTEEWKKQFSEFEVGIFTGDYGGSGKPYPVSFRDAQLLIMTPERLDACTRSWRQHWSWIPEVDLVIADEIHLLNDVHRGPRLEGALSRFRRLNPFSRVLGLSATVGNPDELAEWLQGTRYRSDWRPVPLDWRIVRYREASAKPKLLSEEVCRNVNEGGKSLVFVQSRRRAETLSSHLQESGLDVEHHHAGLIHAERQSVEERFRSGDLDALVATSTLEMGINLPVRQVVLYDIQRYDGVGFTPLSTNTVWQRVGRAGRPGLDNEGEALLMAPTWDREVEQYPKGSFEPIESQLSEDQALAEQIVTEVASGLSRTPKQLKSNLRLYLAGQQNRLGHLDRVYDEMLSAGMIDERTNERHGKRRLYVNATRLGWVAVRHMLKPATVLLCQRVSSHFDDLSFFDLLLTAACTPDTSPVLPVDFEELDILAEQLQTEPSFLLAEENATITELLDVDEKTLLAGIKMALVMRMWTRTGSEEHVADAFTCYPFEVARLRESMHRVLLAWPSLLDSAEEDVPAWVYDGVAPLNERIGVIRRMVNAGIDEKAATLSLVPGIGSTFASRLSAHGFRDIEDLALAEPNALCDIRGVSKQRADDWITEACHLIGDRPASWYQDVGPETEISRSEWPNDVDPYRLRRALDLTVRKHSTSTFVVSGGLEPHRLQRTGKRTLECDCADAAKGNLCKHVLAVRLRSGDKKLRRLAQQLTEERSDRALSLFDLWYDHSKR